MVRLEAVQPVLVVDNVTDFNSSMVRLEVFIVSLLKWQIVISIPVWCDWKTGGISNAQALAAFQFQYGAIGSRAEEEAIEKEFNFNSSMVRLEGKALLRPLQPLTYFNSSMVRLEAM